MKILSHSAPAHARRGAALLLSLLILLVLVAIVIQINISTGTDARIGRNDVTLTTMDLATESALLQCAEALKADSEADASPAAAGPSPTGAAGGAGATPPLGAGGAAGAPGGGQEQSQPVDSRRDEWATPQRTDINNIKLRIITQDENSKYNVLNLLSADEKEAEAAFDRVVRILDACREGTQYDIDPRTAEEMAKTMREHMLKRRQSKLPRPKLLTDDEKNDDVGMPISLREFLPLEPFEELHFRDFRDSDQKVVHSITTFLTVWSSLATNPKPSASSTSVAGKGGTNGKSTSTNNDAKAGSSSSSGKAGASTAAGSADGGKSGGGTAGAQTGATGGTAGGATAGGTGAATGANDPAAAGSSGSETTASKAASTTGGFGVNVNTAPAAVLKSLFDSREVPGRFWDKVIEYRNLEDEEEKEKEKENAASGTSLDEEEQLDEYGQPILKRQIFKSVQDLSKVDGWDDMAGEFQTKITQILTVQSEVFSVFVIARKSTAQEQDMSLGLTPAEMRKREETRGDSLQRVVHAVLWRQKSGDEVKVVPVIRWEILDYLPYEVLDFPPDDR